MVIYSLINFLAMVSMAHGCCYTITTGLLSGLEYSVTVVVSAAEAATTPDRQYNVTLQFPAIYTLRQPVAGCTPIPSTVNAYSCFSSKNDIFQSTWDVTLPSPLSGSITVDVKAFGNQCSLASVCQNLVANAIAGASGDSSSSESTVSFGSTQIPSRVFWPVLATFLFALGGLALLAYIRTRKKGEPTNDEEYQMTTSANKSGWFGELNRKPANRPAPPGTFTNAVAAKHEVTTDHSNPTQEVRTAPKPLRGRLNYSERQRHRDELTKGKRFVDIPKSEQPLPKALPPSISSSPTYRNTRHQTDEDDDDEDLSKIVKRTPVEPVMTQSFHQSSSKRINKIRPEAGSLSPTSVPVTASPQKDRSNRRSKNQPLLSFSSQDEK